jgi:hypothetical protein
MRLKHGTVFPLPSARGNRLGKRLQQRLEQERLGIRRPRRRIRTPRIPPRCPAPLECAAPSGGIGFNLPQPGLERCRRSRDDLGQKNGQRAHDAVEIERCGKRPPADQHVAVRGDNRLLGRRDAGVEAQKR